MIRRINYFIDQRQYNKAEWIMRTLEARSISYKNLHKKGTWNADRHVKKFLDQANIIIFSYAVLLIGGAGATAETTPLEVTTESTSQGIAPFITCVVLILTILIVMRQSEVKDLPISGPMTESEYEWLQDTLAYQAWLDNLSLSPIGELWKLPF